MIKWDVVGDVHIVAGKIIAVGEWHSSLEWRRSHSRCAWEIGYYISDESYSVMDPISKVLARHIKCWVAVAWIGDELVYG